MAALSGVKAVWLEIEQFFVCDCSALLPGTRAVLCYSANFAALPLNKSNLLGIQL